MESEIVPTRVGQESHPAIRRPQFRAEAQPHLGQPVGRRGEIRKALLLNAGITTPLTKRAPSPGRQKKAPTPFRHQGGHNCPHCGQLSLIHIWKGEIMNSTIGNRSIFERVFHLSERGTTLRTELIAGATTFLSCVSIMVLNPTILAAAGMDQKAVFWATALSSCIGCLWIGLWGNFPFALGPAMGLNSYMRCV